MSNLVKFDPATIELFKYGGVGVPLPFSRDILLLETHIAGTTYLDDPEGLATRIKPSDQLTMKREPNNEYDANAILLFTQQGEKAGYLPRDKNEVIARLMDAGKICFAQIVDFEFVV
jgi:hypothetical protein